MTLKRQLSLMASALILLLLTGNLFLTLTNSSNYFEQQLNARAYDAATSLALSMSNAVVDGDKVKLERMIDVLFDRGFFSEISLQLLDGSRLQRKVQPLIQNGAAPEWFVDMVDLAVIPAYTDVTQGWQRLGSLMVKSHTDLAYRDLWSIIKAEVTWYLWMALVSLISLQIILRWMFKPLEQVEQQALDISERKLYEQEKLPRARELRRVVLAMNQMVRKLKTIFAEQSAITEKLREENYHDDVSQLLNRRGFDQRLQHILQQPDGYSGVLVLMQVQEFAQYNQEQGREAGDEILFRIGEIFNQWHRDHNDVIISRRTGADFSLYIPATDLTHGEELVEQCFNLLSTTVLTQRGGMNFHFGALFIERSLVVEGTQTEHPLTLVDALSKADVALRQAQTQHTSRYGFYAKSTQDDIERTASEWKGVLEKVLQEESIELHYQPILDSKGEKVIHFEVLSRIYDQQGIISAARFWPMVERHQLTPNFDLLVIKTLLGQLQSSVNVQPEAQEKFCINLSAGSVLSETFHDQLEELLALYPQWRELLCIEISECSISHIEFPLARLAHRLKSQGVELGIDQVGTGSLAFAYLQRLPLSYLRIAGSFNRGLHLALDHKFFIQSMVQIAHNLDLQVLGEGVENEDDIKALKQTGVDGMGGYYFTPPINDLNKALEWRVKSK